MYTDFPTPCGNVAACTRNRWAIFAAKPILPTMPLTTLRDDLMQEFREECIMIREQMEILDPLGTSLRKPAAQRLISTTTLIITEIICYALFLGGIAFIAMMHTIYPFNVGNTIYHTPEISNKLGGPNVNNFLLAGYGIVALAVVLFLAIARMARAIRLKNEILHQAGKDIKLVLGMHLERRAAIDTLEQRHMLNVSGISLPAEKSNKVNINEVGNPGYDEDEDNEPQPVNKMTWRM